jgi:hypothetical protein
LLFSPKTKCGRDLAGSTSAAPAALTVVFCKGTGLFGLGFAVGRVHFHFFAAKAKFFLAALFFDVEGALLAFGVSDLAEAVHARSIALLGSAGAPA